TSKVPSAKSGNNRLGGDDFDQRIVDWVVEEFRKETTVDLSKDLLQPNQRFFGQNHLHQVYCFLM
ncbi:MAG TPA: Hsp70 family protein, partial [Acholeplasmataceae bacterium]|nr:Hsp70 family protein [Acholeplasmataceae bacterium]